MLTLTLGCMYAGKTSALVKNIPERDYIVLDYARCVSPYVSTLSTHDNIQVSCTKTQTLLSVDVSTYHTILINEAQFFDDLIPFVTQMKSKHIHIYGLDGDFKQERFGDILSLIPICDSYVKLYAICKCGELAPFSKRLSNNQEQFSIDDPYRPSCRQCLNSYE